MDDLSLSEYSGGRRGQADGHGSVEAVDMDLVDTYGYWDQSLDIMPALSRYVDSKMTLGVNNNQVQVPRPNGPRVQTQKSCPRIIIFEELELISFVSQGLNLSTASLVY